VSDGTPSGHGATEPATAPTTRVAREDVDVGEHLTPEQFQRPSDPEVAAHLARCRLCRRLADVERRAPLPKDLVTESAFRWPAEPMAMGGMAAVFKGDDKRLGRTVILKVPRQDDELPASMNEMFQARLETEARVLARLQHPSIVTIYEVGRTTTGAPFCVLERVDGTSLRDRLDELAEQEKDGGSPRTRERLELVSNLVSIAEAMAYAHDRGIVHRDLNPNNILIGKRGEATLIDWGIAKDTGHSAESLRMTIMNSSQSGRAQTISAGTPPFVCFAQSQGYPAEPGFDVYSFGMTLYEVVAGKLPYEFKPGGTDEERQTSLMAFLDWAEKGPPAPPAAPRDPELSGIIARAITRDDERRFSADELLRALKQYLTGELVFSHRYSASGRLSRWVRKHRGATVAMVLAAASIVAGTVIWLGVRAREATYAKERAQLGAQAVAAQMDAANKALTAEQAAAEAARMLSRAEAAERNGQDAQALRAAAEAKRLEAEAAAKTAAAAAAQAATDASNAKAESDAALASAQAAAAARQTAEQARDAAIAERDAAQAAQRAAEAAKAAEVTARERAQEDLGRAEEARAAAIQARDAAIAERDAASASSAASTAAREAAERALATAEAKLAALERRVRDLEQQLGGAGGGDAGSGG
jgi:tRNA A-37 threonylcarbamoyl transferase component Bud32